MEPPHSKTPFDQLVNKLNRLCDSYGEKLDASAAGISDWVKVKFRAIHELHTPYVPLKTNE